MKVSDIMTLGAATAQVDDPIAKALRTMLSHNISALPVEDGDGQLQGIITEGDFFRPNAPCIDLKVLLAMTVPARATALNAQKVGAFMTQSPVTIDAEASVFEAITLMENHSVKRLPVTSGRSVVGLISRSDLLRILNA